MKVLGIEVKGSDTIVVLLSGSRSDCTLTVPENAKLALPKAAGTEVENLLLLKEQLRNVIRYLTCDCVAYVAANDSSCVIRAKIECMLQLAAHEEGIPSHGVAAQSVAADQNRRVEKETGQTLDSLVHGIKPAYVTRAAHCAWSKLDA
jgi:hypothetical protein